MTQHRDSHHTGRRDIKVLLVDDHAVVREGLRLLLTSDPSETSDISVVAEAGTAREAQARLATTDVDVALVDVMLPDGDGIQLCRQIREDHPATACVVLTSYPDAHLVLAATLAGASSFLSKCADRSEVADAIRAATRGERRLDGQAAAQALESVSHEYAEHRTVGRLTEQERRVFALVGQGLSNNQIAERMYLTEKTVKNYVSRMLSKLSMDRRTEAAVLAARLAERRNRHGGLAHPHTAAAGR